MKRSAGLPGGTARKPGTAQVTTEVLAKYWPSGLPSGLPVGTAQPDSPGLYSHF